MDEGGRVCTCVCVCARACMRALGSGNIVYKESQQDLREEGNVGSNMTGRKNIWAVARY